MFSKEGGAMGKQGVALTIAEDRGRYGPERHEQYHRRRADIRVLVAPKLSPTSNSLDW